MQEGHEALHPVGPGCPFVPRLPDLQRSAFLVHGCSEEVSAPPFRASPAFFSSAFSWLPYPCFIAVQFTLPRPPLTCFLLTLLQSHFCSVYCLLPGHPSASKNAMIHRLSSTFGLPFGSPRSASFLFYPRPWPSISMLKFRKVLGRKTQTGVAIVLRSKTKTYLNGQNFDLVIPSLDVWWGKQEEIEADICMRMSMAGLFVIAKKPQTFSNALAPKWLMVHRNDKYYVGTKNLYFSVYRLDENASES